MLNLALEMRFSSLESERAGRSAYSPALYWLRGPIGPNQTLTLRCQNIGVTYPAC